MNLLRMLAMSAKSPATAVLILPALWLAAASQGRAQSVSASGYWAGVRVETGFFPAALQLNLVEAPSGTVSGTAFIQDVTDPTAYAVLSTVGAVSVIHCSWTRQNS